VRRTVGCRGGSAVIGRRLAEVAQLQIAYLLARLRRAVQLDRLLYRNQRRLQLRQIELDQLQRHQRRLRKGALVGATLGYNLQTGSWVWGLEADGDASWIKGSGCGSNCETRNRWLGTGRTRIGCAWDRWLPYVTGGAAFGDVKMTPFSNCASENKTKVGWTAGVGVEYAFMGAWSVKLEYLYVDLGTSTFSVTTCGLSN
jgi:opacity protein-like surface antigen